MARSIAQHDAQTPLLQSAAVVALRSATVVTICLLLAWLLFQKTWLLAVVCGVCAGLGVLFLIQPISHQHQAISDSYD